MCQYLFQSRMQSKSTDFVSPRTERYRNRQVKKELGNEGQIQTSTVTDSLQQNPQLPARVKRCLQTPSQQRKVKKMREDKKNTPPLPQEQEQTEVHSYAKPSNTTELVSVGDKTLLVEEWVRQFEQFSNSKQSLALSILVPRYPLCNHYI